jgi:hypothetical protein
MEEFFNIVGSFGFPVAVAGYLLFRFEKKLEDLSKVNGELCVEIRSLEEKVVELESTINKLKRK